MFAPSVRSQIITDGTTASATPVINLPATVVAGDTLLVVFRVAVAGAIAFPAGWTELFDASSDGADDQMAAAWKLALGTEGGTTIGLTCTLGKFAACAWSIANAADPVLQPPQLSTVATGTSAAQPNSTVVTPTGGSRNYLFGVIAGMEGEQTGVTTYPTSYTLAQLFSQSGTAGAVTTNVRVAGAFRQLTGASDDPGVWAIGGTMDDWTAYTIVFHPKPALEGLKVSETIELELTGAAGNLSRNISAEHLRGLDVWQSGVDLLAQNPIRITDTVSAKLNPQPVLVAAESLKGDDIGQGVVELLAPGIIHLTDGPVVATLEAGAADLSVAITSESLNVSDSVTADRVSVITLTVAVATEQLELDDIGQGVIDLLGVVHVVDGPVVAALEAGVTDLTVAVQDVLKLSDGPIVAELTPLERVLATDALKLTDTLTVSRELDGLPATEHLELTDTVTVARGLDAVLQDELKITDAVTASVNLASSLTEDSKVSDAAFTTLDPLESSPAEALKVVDSTPIGQHDPLELSRTDALKISDTVTPTMLGVDMSVVLSESVRAWDVLYGVARFVASQNTRTAGLLEHSLSLSDAVSTQIQLGVVLTAESLDLADAVTTTLDPLQAVRTESLELSETTARTLDPLEPLLADALRLTDTVTASVNLSVLLQDSLELADTSTGGLTPLLASPQLEALELSDQITVDTGNLPAVLSESLKLADPVSTVLNELETTPAEALKLTDTHTVALTPLLVLQGQEAVTLVDAVTVVLNPLQPAISEGLTLSDTDIIGDASGTITVLLTEHLKIKEDLVLPGPSDTELRGTYQPETPLFGTYTPETALLGTQEDETLLVGT